jgi:hypothetical protein
MSWSVSPDANPAWRCWDGDLVVHHRLANDTHRLGDEARRVWMCLAIGGAQTLGALADGTGLPRDALERVLAALESLGLAHRC